MLAQQGLDRGRGTPHGAPPRPPQTVRQLAISGLGVVVVATAGAGQSWKVTILARVSSGSHCLPSSFFPEGQHRVSLIIWPRSCRQKKPSVHAIYGPLIYGPL